MVDAVSAGASAAVEELATFQRTSSISAVAAKDGVMSVSFLPGGIVIGARATLLARCIGVESVRVWWASLKGQSGAGLRYLTITLAPTGLVTVCSVKVILVEEHGHSPPPLPHFSWGLENLSLFYVLCSLERQSGTRFTLPARHRKSISYSCGLRAQLCSLGSRLRL